MKSGPDHPANSKAFNGIEMCKKHLSQDKNPLMEPVSSSKKSSAFFTPSPITSNAVPPELQEALKVSSIGEYIKKGHVTLEQLIELQNTKPWVIDALRYSNIGEGIYNHHTDIEQLSKLTQEQVASITGKFEGNELQSKVDSFVKFNQKVI